MTALARGSAAPSAARRRLSVAWLKTLAAAPLSAKLGLFIVVFYVAIALSAPWISPYGEAEIVGSQFEPWSGKFLLGTDNLGRDMLNVSMEARVMNERPFGPLAIINSFGNLDAATAEANRLPFGLASYGSTGSIENARALATRVEAGMTTINHNGLALPEVPFGGIKDSGYGNEGGSEAIDAYLVTKSISVT